MKEVRIGLGVLAVPGIVVLAALTWLRRRVPDPAAYETAQTDISAAGEPESAQGQTRARQPMPSLLWQYVAAVAVLSCGVASFPLLAFHAQTQGLLTAAQVPVLFALAMTVDGLSGLVIGRVYDRHGPNVLLLVPVAASFAAIAFTPDAPLVWIGVAIWGVVNGVLDSTIKAVVTRLVPPGTRATAFGWLALVRGVGLLVAGGILGLAYDHSITLAIWLIVAANAVALTGLWSVLRHSTIRPVT
jgi:predicted MFS family arabinose efflux permease